VRDASRAVCRGVVGQPARPPAPMNEPFPTSFREIVETVARYYNGRLREFGPTPRGVDWNSAESQVLRFSRLLTVADHGTPMSVIDYGCGYGALATYLRSWGAAVSYQGFDICDAMIEAAGALHADDEWCSFTSSASALRPAEYAVASGIFNVKLE